MIYYLSLLAAISEVAVSQFLGKIFINIAVLLTKLNMLDSFELVFFDFLVQCLCQPLKEFSHAFCLSWSNQVHLHWHKRTQQQLERSDFSFSQLISKTLSWVTEQTDLLTEPRSLYILSVCTEDLKWGWTKQNESKIHQILINFFVLMSKNPLTTTRIKLFICQLNRSAFWSQRVKFCSLICLRSLFSLSAMSRVIQSARIIKKRKRRKMFRNTRWFC